MNSFEDTYEILQSTNSELIPAASGLLVDEGTV